MAKKLNKEEREVYNRYHISNTSNMYRCKVNAVMLNTHNALPHEIKKAEIAYELIKSGCKIISEAERNKKRGERRKIVDIVDLSANKEIEIIYKHENHFDVARYRDNGVIPIIVNPFECEKCHKLFPERSKRKVCDLCK